MRKSSPRSKREPKGVSGVRIRSAGAVVPTYPLMKREAHLQVKNGVKSVKAKAVVRRRTRPPNLRPLFRTLITQNRNPSVQRNSKIQDSPSLTNFPLIWRPLLGWMRPLGMRSLNKCGLILKKTNSRIPRISNGPSATRNWRRSSARRSSNVLEWPSILRRTSFRQLMFDIKRKSFVFNENRLNAHPTRFFANFRFFVQNEFFFLDDFFFAPLLAAGVYRRIFSLMRT